MCGIVGYYGKRNVPEVVINGLKKLEYRGYDSSGMACVDNNIISLLKSVGKIKNLEEKFNNNPIKGTVGIGHSRWATHGIPSEANAHPHIDCKNKIAVVHNGIIENFMELKNELISKGHKFVSDTDTEVIAHLIEDNYTGDFEDAFKKSVPLLKGAFAIAVICADYPDTIFFARMKSPLVIGLGKGETFLASDVIAFLTYAREVVYIDNGQLGLIKKGKISMFDFKGNPVKYKTSMVLWDAEMAEKNGYKHFMLKEIYEQPECLSKTINGTIRNNDFYLPNFNIPLEELKKIRRISIVACGTAYHAGFVGKYFIEELAKLPVDIDVASEFIYREPIISDDTLFIAISQSGETADTIEAVRKAKQFGAKTVAVTNVVGSSITREVDGIIYTHAGFELGVAATKSFTAQVLVMYVISLYLAKIRKMISEETLLKYILELSSISQKIELILQHKNIENIKMIARIYQNCRDFLFLGRNVNYPLALEGALKLKEISYIHAEGYAAGEMKHGPIALIDSNCPVVVIMTKSKLYEKVISNIQEVSARHGLVIGIASEDDETAKTVVKNLIKIPVASPYVSAILSVIPLQLLSYHIADVRGCNIDKPRNLAKSVTVE